jgi:hypothetical protein
MHSYCHTCEDNISELIVNIMMYNTVIILHFLMTCIYKCQYLQLCVSTSIAGNKYFLLKSTDIGRLKEIFKLCEMLPV